MLSMTGMIVALDAYGPITDNAGGIAEMAGLPKEVRNDHRSARRGRQHDQGGDQGLRDRLGRPRRAGAVRRLHAQPRDRRASRRASFDLSDPAVIIGLFIGGLVPYLFGAMAMEAVGRADLVEAPVVVSLLEPAWEGGNRLVRRATAGAPGVDAGTPVLTDGTVCGEALLAGRPVRVPDMADAPETLHAAACCPGARSLLSVPLLDGPLVVGVVSALSERPDWFDRMDERAVALAVQIAGPQLAALPPYPFGAERPGAAGRRPTPVVPAPTPGPPPADLGPESHPGGMTSPRLGAGRRTTIITSSSPSGTPSNALRC